MDEVSPRLYSRSQLTPPAPPMAIWSPRRTRLRNNIYRAMTSHTSASPTCSVAQVRANSIDEPVTILCLCLLECPENVTCVLTSHMPRLSSYRVSFHQASTTVYWTPAFFSYSLTRLLYSCTRLLLDVHQRVTAGRHVSDIDHERRCLLLYHDQPAIIHGGPGAC